MKKNIWYNVNITNARPPLINQLTITSQCTAHYHSNTLTISYSANIQQNRLKAPFTNLGSKFSFQHRTGRQSQ
jgi:hypothetical protein